jgi:phage terminase small subunit
MTILKNTKHELFAQALAKGETATKAYVTAGYEKNDGNAIRLKGNERIKARVAEILSRGADRAEITQERVLRELGKIGFSDIRKAVQWGEGLSVADAETGETRIVNGVSLVGSEDIDDDTAGAIAEVSQTKDGLKIKLHDKRSALVDIGRHLGMFKEDKDKNGEIHLHFDGLLKGVL